MVDSWWVCLVVTSGWWVCGHLGVASRLPRGCPWCGRRGCADRHFGCHSCHDHDFVVLPLPPAQLLWSLIPCCRCRCGCHGSGGRACCVQPAPCCGRCGRRGCSDLVTDVLRAAWPFVRPNRPGHPKRPSASEAHRPRPMAGWHRWGKGCDNWWQQGWQQGWQGRHGWSVAPGAADPANPWGDFQRGRAQAPDPPRVASPGQGSARGLFGSTRRSTSTWARPRRYC